VFFGKYIAKNHETPLIHKISNKKTLTFTELLLSIKNQ
jgi:hypothetical protein